ncbi:ankyrin repeat domain-containing protein [Aspergillus mulundensis]|uniref:Uncharacterized protein n=1 Tax=Aspergillus mulundensis TaxID=1810919 RepID=A0A3D8S5G0_9EURO|nr:hypothetical protein DSM5745_05100 [Aspergillus mulundensis]RDW81543.1 hypothetical protein DSM5745_05100 [Aspergillus mulundensis]
MAEAFGIAAGAVNIVSLLEQIIESISKLKALRAFMKTAPEDLQNLIEEIEIIQAVLLTLRAEGLTFLNLPSIESRLQAFHRDLQALMLEISACRDTATKGRVGILKLVLKKETLRMHRQNLDSFKSTLLLLQQAYCSVSLYEMNSRISMQSSAPQDGTTELAECKTNTSYQINTQRRKRQDLGQRVLRFRTPLFFVDKMWTIGSSHILSGWKFTFQVNNVIPDDAPVVQHCKNGDVGEVQRLLSEGLASPFDCKANGRSLLHIAVSQGRIDMCRLLLDVGADLNHTDNQGLTCCQYLDYYIAWGGIELDKISLASDLYRLCIGEIDNELLANDEQREWDDGRTSPYWETVGFGGPPEVLTMINSRCFERYSELPLDVRFNRAIRLNTFMNHFPNPAVIRIAMGGGDHIDPAAFILDDRGETLLHKIAEGMATDISAKRSDKIAEWRRLLAEATSAGSDLNKVANFAYRPRRSPLLGFLFNFVPFDCKGYWRQPKNFTHILRLWIVELKLTGIDLETYGEKELALYTSHAVFPSLPIWLDCDKFPGQYRSVNQRREGLWARILYLEYGPEPEDWHIYVTNPVDELVGEFWESIQRSLEVMPGTWVD